MSRGDDSIYDCYRSNQGPGLLSIEVIGHYRHRQLVILIDRGSTNYFLNEKVIEDLKVPLV